MTGLEYTIHHLPFSSQIRIPGLQWTLFLSLMYINILNKYIAFPLACLPVAVASPDLYCKTWWLNKYVGPVLPLPFTMYSWRQLLCLCWLFVKLSDSESKAQKVPKSCILYYPSSCTINIRRLADGLTAIFLPHLSPVKQLHCLYTVSEPRHESHFLWLLLLS